ncbi:MAG: tripartite tricarboxylate transporter substrate binding protein [Burkholderiaceae bacterium]|jgi:tripartite-type tricarboxylate transporter receptor subunit TctC|nr:tripartite tricarboxylate transporter substrate binding protein [Burkholderiaceae bacterium]
MSYRIFFSKALLLIGMVFFGFSAFAQSWPTKPIRVVVPFAPGGGTDILARVLAPRLSELLGQPIVIDNKPGASSIIGSQIVAQAPADGYTLLMVDSSILVNPGLRSNLPYDTLKAFTPISHLAVGPVILVVNPSVPAQNLSELVKLAKAKPGELFYGSGGNGASTHLAGELFKMAANINIGHAPFKGTGEAMAAVMGGQVPMTFTGISSAKQPVAAGRLRALALTGERRHPAMPNVPTFAEAGLKGVDASSHWGLLGPANLPAAIVNQLSAAVNKALAESAIQVRVAGLGFDVKGGLPSDHLKLMEVEIEKWRKVIQTAGIKVN